MVIARQLAGATFAVSTCAHRSETACSKAAMLSSGPGTRFLRLSIFVYTNANGTCSQASG